MGSMRIWSPLCSVHAERELKCSLFLSQRHTWDQLKSWFFTSFLGNHSISTKGLRPTSHLLSKSSSFYKSPTKYVCNKL